MPTIRQTETYLPQKIIYFQQIFDALGSGIPRFPICCMKCLFKIMDDCWPVTYIITSDQRILFMQPVIVFFIANWVMAISKLGTTPPLPPLGR